MSHIWNIELDDLSANFYLITDISVQQSLMLGCNNVKDTSEIIQSFISFRILALLVECKFSITVHISAMMSRPNKFP